MAACRKIPEDCELIKLLYFIPSPSRQIFQHKIQTNTYEDDVSTTKIGLCFTQWNC